MCLLLRTAGGQVVVIVTVKSEIGFSSAMLVIAVPIEQVPHNRQLTL